MDYYKLKVLNNKKEIIIGLIILLCLVGAGWYFFYPKEDEVVLIDKKENLESSDEIDDNDAIYVDIKGCINNPGVYSFNNSDNARINDLIIKAGGLTDEADTSLINLSKKLEDEMTIIIYSHKEINEYISVKDELTTKLNLCEIKLKNNACIKSESDTNTDNKLININEASKEELMSLSGIGESKAKAIIEYRKQKKFEEIEEIKNVDGIGDNLFESIKNSITT